MKTQLQLLIDLVAPKTYAEFVIDQLRGTLQVMRHFLTIDENILKLNTPIKLGEHLLLLIICLRLTIIYLIL